MGFMFFIYTMIILVVALLATTINALAYVASWQRTFLLAAIGLFFYFLDELPIFLKDFITQPIVDQGDFFYMIYQPLLMLITGGGFLGCLWLIVCRHLSERRTALLIAPIAVFAGASALALTVVPAGRWQQLCFYACRQAMMFWIAGYGLRRSKAREGAASLRLRQVLIGLAVFAALMIVEDVILMVIIDPFALSPSFPVYATERNFVENVLFFWLAYLSIRQAGAVLRITE